MSITPESTDVLALALDYAKRGWRIIPLHNVNEAGACSCRKGSACTSAGKHPKNNVWQESPALSVPDIHGTFDANLVGESAVPNLGIAVGEPSGFWVLDIDPKGGGMDTMAALVTEHGRLPDTFVVRTGSGGFHYYFALPDFELRNSQNRVGPGIDTRADGGQVVAAPSVSDKGPYAVVADHPLAAAPDWLLEVARKAETTIADVTAADLPKPEDIGEEEWKRLNGYAESVVKAEVKRLTDMSAAAVKAGRSLETYRGEPWNATTFQVSASLIEIANSPWCSYGLGQAYADVHRNAPRDSGFTDEEVNRTFDSARSKVGDKARPVPENRRVEPDALFDSPDVRPGPTGPAEGQPTPSGDTPSPTGRAADDFFEGRSDLLVADLAAAVTADGPLGRGVDSLFWSYADGVWGPDDEIVNTRVGNILGNRYRTGHVSNTEGYLKGRVQRITAEPLPKWINFKNGMLDWQTGEVVPHDADYLSTIQMQIDWNPEATCPNFDHFLSEVLKPDYVKLCWEMLGYLLLSGNPLQRAFLLYGAGGNGKGTLLRVIQSLIGKHNLSAESLDDLNSSNFSSVNLHGKIANIAGDIDSTFQEHTAAFKKITGEDEIGAEHKYGRRFYFTSWAVPVFSANAIPGSADTTDGYLRRWIVLHFHKKITNIVPGLDRLLATELEGIAVKAVEALRGLMHANEFTIEGDATEGADMMRAAVDQVFRWTQSAPADGGPLFAPEVITSLSSLYTGYKSWAARTGQSPLGENKFSERVEALGYERVPWGESVEGFKGISIQSHVTAEGEPPSAGFF